MNRTALSVTCLTGAALVVAMLSGCSAQQMAAPDVIGRGASIKGSNMCVVNNSSTTMRVTWRGIPDSAEIPPAGSRCHSGYDTSQNDVRGVIDYEPASKPGSTFSLHVDANNPFMFAPTATVVVKLSSGQWSGACGDFAVGNIRQMDTGWLHAEMKRESDSDENKEFVLTLTDNVGDFRGNICIGVK